MKYVYWQAEETEKEININMRCIEITETVISLYFLDWININMRCIEIMLLLQQAVVGLD